MDNPCVPGCVRRSPECHGKCELYRQYRAERDEAIRRKREEKAIEDTLLKPRIRARASRRNKGR